MLKLIAFFTMARQKSLYNFLIFLSWDINAKCILYSQIHSYTFA